MIHFGVLFLLLLFSKCCSNRIDGFPRVCAQIGSIRLQRISDLGSDSFGKSLVTVFSPLQCANCYNYLRRLDEIANSYKHIKLIVIAPDFESNHVIARSKAAFPSLIIDRSIDGWSKYSASNFDIIIIDACGKVAETFRWPQSDVTQSQNVRAAIARTTGCRQCYESRIGNGREKINAYLDAYKMQNNNNHQRAQQWSSQLNYPNQGHQQVQQQRKESRRTINRQMSSPEVFYNKNNFATTSRPKASFVTTESTMDYSDYYDEESQPKTTQKPMTQIPKPPSKLPNWPTRAPFRAEPQSSYTDPQNFDSDLPCSAYSDDICYHQQDRLGHSLSKCCKKGVYMTDVCVPGKCSNSTQRLCCFQKFLQAKYSCCNDPSQDDLEPNKSSTIKFSKCCYDQYVNEDPCCPERVAKKYWNSVYELCFPKTFVNFTNVRFEVHFNEGVRVIDMSMNKQWNFNCTHGHLFNQLAYFP